MFEEEETLEELVEHYIENNLTDNNKAAKYIANMLRDSLYRYEIAKKPLAKIRVRAYTEMLRSEGKRKGGLHAGRLLHRMKSILSYGVRFEFLQHSPLATIRIKDIKAIPSKPRKTKLVGDDILHYWNAIEIAPISMSLRNMLKLTLIFGSRISELRLSEKKEFDFDNMTWTVPAVKSKTGVVLVRAIPQLARDILMDQFQGYSMQEFVFPRYKERKDLPMSRSTVYRAGQEVAEIMKHNNLPSTGIHDMRRTARNYWESIGFDYKVSEVMLGHSVHKGVSAHYLDINYIPEQRKQYEIWVEYLMSSERLIDSLAFPDEGVVRRDSESSGRVHLREKVTM